MIYNYDDELMYNVYYLIENVKLGAVPFTIPENECKNSVG